MVVVSQTNHMIIDEKSEPPIAAAHLSMQVKVAVKRATLIGWKARRRDVWQTLTDPFVTTEPVETSSIKEHTNGYD